MLVQMRAITRRVLLPDESTLHILRGIDLDVDAGDHVAIVGRSGTGKSTLLNILGLLDVADSGTYLLDGEPVAALSSAQRTRRRGDHFGFVFQQFNLLPGCTALANVVAPLMYAGGSRFWRRERLAQQMLQRVGLGARVESLPSQLSGGEQQRVAIARALVRAPRVILADEPTGALDVETGAEVMGLLNEIAAENGAALITITHDLSVAARANRHYQLSGGTLRPFDPHTRSADGRSLPPATPLPPVIPREEQRR